MTYLGQLVKVDRAQSDVPLPIGGGQWQWFRQTQYRLRLTDRARHELGLAQVVLAVDARGRQVGIAYGEDILTRIMTTGVAEPVRFLRVILDGTARRLGDNESDGDLDLLAAACCAVKDPAPGDPMEGQ